MLPTEQIKLDLVDGLALHRDGYHLARWLEDQRDWDSDGNLVAILNYASFLRNDIYDQRVRDWVKNNQIHPELSVGDAVRVRDGEGAEHTGQIRCINYEEAQYQVFVESMGHTQRGAGVQAMGVPYELVEQA